MPEGRARRVQPVGFGVVDEGQAVRAGQRVGRGVGQAVGQGIWQGIWHEIPEDLQLRRAAREGDDTGAGPQCLLYKKCAKPARSTSHDHDVGRGNGRYVEGVDGHSAGADHGYRVGRVEGSAVGPVGDRVQLLGGDDDPAGVPAAVGHRAEVGRHPPPGPRGVDPGADSGHGARDLAAGDRRQARQGERRAGLAAADAGVEEVHAVCDRVDQHLARSGDGVRDLLEREDLGRSEGVVSDRVHALIL